MSKELEELETNWRLTSVFERSSYTHIHVREGMGHPRAHMHLPSSDFLHPAVRPSADASHSQSLSSR